MLDKKCTKMCTFCIHFSSKCILQNVYFINVHKINTMWCIPQCLNLYTFSSSETQGQIVGARESLNIWKNMPQRKVKNARRAPGDNVLPDQFQTVAAVLPSDWAENTKLFWHQSEVRTAATIWNWSGKTLSPGALLNVLYFYSCHIFLPV